MVLNVRNLAAWLYGIFLLSRGSIRKLKEKSQNGEIILSVYFHNPSKKLFEKSVQWFLKRGFRFISVNELLAIKENNLPFPPMAVIFTVDDGWKNNKNNIFNVAEKYQIPVTTFISTQPVETGDLYWWTYVEIAKKNNWEVPSVSAMKQLENDQRLQIVNGLKSKIKSIRDALLPEEIISFKNSKYVNFGAHTVTHPILSKCDYDTSFFEIVESQKKLETWLNYSINSFAYPNGNYTEREIEILKLSNYKIAFNTIPDYITPNNISSIYELPRFDVLENVSFVENVCRMTGLWFENKTKTNVS